jgi:hypothetical protein
MRTVARYTPFQKTLMIALEIALYISPSPLQSPVSRLSTCVVLLQLHNLTS